MPNDDAGPWIGASGAEYMYYIFDLDASVPSRMGTYIYAKTNPDNLWVPIYMGYGDLAIRCDDTRRLACIGAKAATHVHLRLNPVEQIARAELRDLLARYANAFPPSGCNDGEDLTREA